MLRWAFAIYMVFVTAAGPGLCCCSLTHLFAGTADRPERPAAPADLPPCCQHSSVSQEYQGGCPRERQGDDRHKPGCPCRRVEATPVALLDPAFEVAHQFHDVSPFSALRLEVAFDGLLGLNGVVALSGDPPPFMSTDDLLHVHHQLRC